MLPYPGYTWSLTQHMGRVTADELFAILAAAYRYREHDNYRSLINQALASSNIFTLNIRKDSQQVDTWRDYQQILPELGLIYSTRYTSRPRLTPLGLMYIDGEIGYSELFTIQSLIYQYPNGHKTGISVSQKEALQQAGLDVPASRAELDANAGVLIKPGILVLQILVELYNQGLPATISARECLLALTPTKQNSEWLQAYERLIRLRRGEQISSLSSYGIMARIRPVQEWFDFLSRTDFIEGDRQRISLSTIAMDEIEILESILKFHLNSNNVWLPTDFNKENFINWYSYFGSPQLEFQWYTPEKFRTSEYIEENYLSGAETQADIEPITENINIKEINLRPFVPNIPEVKTTDVNLNIDSFVAGQKKRQEKTRLHQEILNHLGQRLNDLSYQVSDDRRSVDLLAIRDGNETIFEVKTTNAKDFWSRIRLGVGQLSEYRYRRQLQTQSRPNSILVISSKFNLQSWMIDYYSSDVKIGLLYAQLDSFTALTNGEVEKEIQQS